MPAGESQAIEARREGRPDDERRQRRLALAEAMLVAAALAAVVVASTFGLWRATLRSVDAAYRDHLVALASAVAQQVDPQLHAALRDPAQIDGPDYEQAVRPLRRLREAVPELRFVYTVVRDGDLVRFVLDAAEPGDHDGDGVDDRSALGEVYLHPDEAMLEALGDGRHPGHVAATREPSRDKWGTFFSGYAPFYDARGRQLGAVGVDVDSGTWLAHRREARDHALAGLVPAMAATLLVSGVFYRLRLRSLTAAERLGRARREAEGALARLDEYRAAIDYHDALVVTDARGIIVEVNDRFCRLSGYTREELVGTTHQRMRSSVHPESFWEDLRARVIAGEIWQGEVCKRARSGALYWVNETIVPMRGPDGAIREAVAISTDITARRRSEDILARERQSLANVIEATATGTWEWNIQTGEVVTNDRLATMLGHEPAAFAQIRFTTWESLIHPEDVDRVGDALEACFVSGAAAYECEFRMRHVAGHWVWVVARGNVVERGADGSPRRMAGTQQDITARMAIETALKDSERKFRGLFELAPVGIALNDYASGQFLEVNDALVAPTGYTREEFLALSYWDITPREYGDQEQQQLDSMEQTGQYGPYEKEYIRKDGTRYPVLLSGRRMTDATGRDVIWSIVQDISQRKAMERELADAAWTDRLTGLPNRTSFVERLEHAVRAARANPRRGFAVLFLDFDRFKLVNDTLGHAAGDVLLRQIAERLRSTLRASDTVDETGASTVARFGGDEFIVLVNELRNPDDGWKVAERLLNALAPVYHVGGREVHSSASIGIVTSAHGTDSAEAIIRNADVAMYEAKRSGRGCAVVFNEGMHTRLARNLTIESALRKALGTDQLYLVYQPIVELEGGRLVSAEALLRWDHPQLGPVSPGEFVPIAEESGLIVPLGDWVLRESCRQFMDWRRESPARAPRTISVNVARAQLALGDRLLERVREVLAETGMPAGCLQLEVTEREVMREPEATRRLMRELRGLGVRLAMDDFGTGTSSLGCLREYPFDAIKIDRSFVNDLEGNADVLAVLHATVTLVENLGMTSVAEGVERVSQVAILQSVGCRYAQGYFFAKPAPAEQFLDALERGVARAAANSVTVN